MFYTHNQECFYKYTTASTAEKILESGNFLFSAPHFFNDPFDHQVSFKFMFTGEEAARRTYEVSKKIIFGDSAPNMVMKTDIGEDALRARERRLQQQISSKAKVLKSIREAANQTIPNFPKLESEVNKLVINILSDFRVLCVSETHENVVMWSHYSEKHQGAVIKLHNFNAVKDNLLLARKVLYRKEFPEFLSLNEWVDGMYGLKYIDYGTLTANMALVKHKDWSYEREWRVLLVPFSPTNPFEEKLYLRKDPSVFGALYLGCKMPADKQQKLIKIAKRRYPHMEIYKALKSKSTFMLEFEKI